MQFTLIDKITQVEPGRQIVAVKTLALAEEYLSDHFPLFPVMPGVLMLESITQTGAWLLRITDDFAHSIVVLKEARNVKYLDFVQPGSVLTVTVTLGKRVGNAVHMSAAGMVDGRLAVTARLVLESYNLAGVTADGDIRDKMVTMKLREQLLLLHRPLASGLGT